MTAQPTASRAFRVAEQRAAEGYGLALSEQYLEIGSPVGRARVIEAGGGPPVLFVHGGGGFAAHWLPLMARLSGRRMIAVDRPGCGLTDEFRYTGTSDVRQHAVTFLSGVADALDLDAMDIVANSMGGLWSLWFALDRPERVRSLALLGCPALAAGTSAPALMQAHLDRIVARH
jgi:pimeloyl-ACP methyl ester carboxylesterase